MTKYELDHLRYLDSPGPFFAVNKGNFIPELRHLLLMHFIDRQPNRWIGSMEVAFTQNGRVNVKDYVYITDEGKAYLKEMEQN